METGSIDTIVVIMQMTKTTKAEPVETHLHDGKNVRECVGQRQTCDQSFSGNALRGSYVRGKTAMPILSCQKDFFLLLRDLDYIQFTIKPTYDMSD